MMAKMLRNTHLLLLGLLLGLLLLFVKDAGATILLFGNQTLSFPTLDASFTPPIPEIGLYGEVHVADPLNGCSAFEGPVTVSDAFAVVERGGCLFEDKVRNSQNAGCVGTIVFDNGEDNLVTMSGDGEGITTYALFVSKVAGESLLGLEGGSVYILPGSKKTSFSIKWLIICVSIIVVVIVGALVLALYCIRAHILAVAREEALNEQLLQDDDYDILNREFIPDEEGLKVEGATTDIDGENTDVPTSEGPPESNYTLENPDK